MDLKKQPLWLNVVDEIVRLVKNRGYGIFMSHEELKNMLGIKTPKTIEEYSKNQFEYLNATDCLRDELLLEHNIYLDNKRGEGYVVLHPDDQIMKGTEKYLGKARELVLKAGQVLVCVERELLSVETEKVRLQKMQKIAFLKSSFRKRKFPAIELKKTPLLEDKKKANGEDTKEG